MQVLERSSGAALMFLLLVIVMSIYMGVARMGQDKLEWMTMDMMGEVEEVLDFKGVIGGDFND